MFSNVCQVCKRANGKLLHVKATVFNSAPGNPKFKEGWVIVVSSSGTIPKVLLWYPAAAVMVLVLGMMWIGSRVSEFRLSLLKVVDC